ncbi:MAG TPA: hypothetical protein VH482_35310 [Thermomicrobiales bacterium]|jgi:hypothetical protein
MDREVGDPAAPGKRRGAGDRGYLTESSDQANARVDERDPVRDRLRGRQMTRYRWPGQTIELRYHGQIVSSASAFNVAFHVQITVDEMPHFQWRWIASFPRRLLRPW